VRFDKYFDSVKDNQISCQWKIRAGFVRIANPRRISDHEREASEVVSNLPPIAHIEETNDNPISAEPTGSSHTDFDEVAAMKAVISDNLGVEPQNEILACSSLIYDDYNMVDDLCAFKATSDPDTLYHHQAMKEDDSAHFKSAMVKEVQSQMDNNNFVIEKRCNVPKGATILPAVWQMKRKRDLMTGKVKKYKARLNIDGSRMRKGRDFELTYAPVATWNAIRMVLAMVLINKWHTVQLDYVLAFPQAPIERTLYMNIPKGMKMVDGNPDDFVLKVNRNIYGQKQAGRVWKKFLVSKLTSKEVGFVQSKYDECVFYKNKMVYILYTDDSIIAGPDRKEIDSTIRLIKQTGLDLTIEGNLSDFLGIHIDRDENGQYTMSQPVLIDKILTDLRLHDDSVKAKPIPMAASRILFRHSSSENFDNSFNYRSVIGKLNYLEKATRPDIAYAAHQCARYSAVPKKEHAAAVRWIGRYLKGTKSKGMVFTPDVTAGLEVHVDADFVGNWDKDDTENADTAKSRHGYVITFAGCPICWKIQLQPNISLSSCESEYVAQQRSSGGHTDHQLD